MIDAGIDVGERTTYSWLVGMQTEATVMEISMDFLQKMEVNLPHDSANSLFSIYSKDSICYYR